MIILRQEMQTIKKELNGISIEPSEVKKSQNKVNGRLDTTEKKISKFEEITKETTEAEPHRGERVFKKKRKRTSLVVQWLRTHLPVQGTLVRFLQGNQALALQSPSPSLIAHTPQQEKPSQ